MHQVLLKHARGLLMSEDVTSALAIHELDLPAGRPDILVASVDLGAFERRRRSGIEPITAPAVATVAAALRKRGEATIDDLVRRDRGGFSREQVRRALNELQKKRVVKAREGRYSTHPAWTVLANEVVGVEAKVEGWRAAAQQARSWAWLVNGVWLAFPEEYLPKIPRAQSGLQQFGLLMVSDESAEVIRLPRWRTVTPTREVLVDETMYGRWLRERATPHRKLLKDLTRSCGEAGER